MRCAALRLDLAPRGISCVGDRSTAAFAIRTESQWSIAFCTAAMLRADVWRGSGLDDFHVRYGGSVFRKRPFRPLLAVRALLAVPAPSTYLRI
jgi:hypothetical protein